MCHPLAAHPLSARSSLRRLLPTFAWKALVSPLCMLQEHSQAMLLHSSLADVLSEC